MKLRRTLLPASAAGAAATLLALGIAGPASAHVTVSPDTTDAGAYALLTFSVPHGCDGAATTKVAIQLPEDIPSVTPTRNPFYKVEKVMEKLDTPIEDSHGNQITERVAQVVYTAKTPLPDGERDAFELSVQLPDAAGETVAFPVVQTCTKGETGWTELAADGGDADDLEHPAPTVTIAEGSGDAHGDGADASGSQPEPSQGDDSDDASADDSDDGSSGLAITGIVVGVLGLAAGGTALARGKKS